MLGTKNNEGNSLVSVEECVCVHTCVCMQARVCTRRGKQQAINRTRLGNGTLKRTLVARQRSLDADNKQERDTGGPWASKEYDLSFGKFPW